MLELLPEHQLTNPFCGSEESPEKHSPQAPWPVSPPGPAAATVRGNAGKYVERHRAERAAVEWRPWMRRVFEEQTLERGERRAAAAERTVCAAA